MTVYSLDLLLFLFGTSLLFGIKEEKSLEKEMATHSHGERSLVGYSPRAHTNLDMTERLHFHFQEKKNSFVRFNNALINRKVIKSFSVRSFSYDLV